MLVTFSESGKWFDTDDEGSESHCPHCGKYLLDDNELYQVLRKDVLTALDDAFTDYYARKIPQKVVKQIVDNVIETSAYQDEQKWNHTDIKCAISRILLPEAWIA